ncbi:hypothetical protein GGS26DRAFT_595021 [Hypomontagnella submonticulosa]|nr:hypothetical protein GGS26DRAFT_595021 [Hypomontagnella submonticulosa]
MCIQVYNKYQLCDHKVYQNTSPCAVAARCSSKDDLLLTHTKFLPDQKPRMPPGMLGCKVQKATRPKDGKCPECTRQERQGKSASSSSNSMSSGSRDTPTPKGQRLTSPSPDTKAVERVRDSLIFLEQQRKTP